MEIALFLSILTNVILIIWVALQTESSQRMKNRHLMWVDSLTSEQKRTTQSDLDCNDVLEEFKQTFQETLEEKTKRLERHHNEREKELKKEVVRHASPHYRKLIDIRNEEYVFKDISESYTLGINHDSKQSFDRFNFEEHLRHMLLLDDYKDIAEALIHNQAMVDRFEGEKQSVLQEPAIVPENVLKVMSMEEFTEFERVLCETECSGVTPIKTTINLSSSYESPGGRNTYYDEKMFDTHEVISLYLDEREKRADKERMKEFVEKQRALLTSSLRYDILQRDEFKCRLCGRNAGEGVELHIDHVQPVSKGGLTEEDNLRTLCKDCNLGKSDKYDLNGVN